MYSYRKGLYRRPRQGAAFPDRRAAANRCPPRSKAQDYIAQLEEANPCPSSAAAGARAWFESFGSPVFGIELCRLSGDRTTLKKTEAGLLKKLASQIVTLSRGRKGVELQIQFQDVDAGLAQKSKV